MTGVSPANRTLAADTGLSHNAIEFLKFINKKGNSEELRTITMINRALDFKPSDLKEKSGPFISIFAFLDQYVTSGDVEWKLRDEYGQGDNESPAKTQRALGIDDIERRIVYLKFDKTLERMELGKLYRESRITALKQGLDELYEAENEKEKPKEKGKTTTKKSAKKSTAKKTEKKEEKKEEEKKEVKSEEKPKEKKPKKEKKTFSPVHKRDRHEGLENYEMFENLLNKKTKRKNTKPAKKDAPKTEEKEIKDEKKEENQPQENAEVPKAE